MNEDFNQAQGCQDNGAPSEEAFAIAADFITAHIARVQAYLLKTPPEMRKPDPDGIVSDVSGTIIADISIDEFLCDALARGLPVRIASGVPGLDEDLLNSGKRIFRQMLEVDPNFSVLNKPDVFSLTHEDFVLGMVFDDGRHGRYDDERLLARFLSSMERRGRLQTYSDMEDQNVRRFISAWHVLSEQQKDTALKPWVDLHRTLRLSAQPSPRTEPA